MPQQSTLAVLYEQLPTVIGELRKNGLETEAKTLGRFLDASCWTTGTELLYELRPVLRQISDSVGFGGLPPAARTRISGCIGLIDLI